MSERVPDVLAAIHLLFNEGYWSTCEAEPIRRDLCRLALSLAESVTQLWSAEPECVGLWVLLRLAEARADARIDEQGSAVPLDAQDRSRWDGSAIDAAAAELREALARGAPGRYQIEAAIACVHCTAASAADTDWAQIAQLYRALEDHVGTPVVRVNRAFAEGMAHGPDAGLALLETVREEPKLADYAYFYLVEGVLRAEAGQATAAATALERAEALAQNDDERAQIRARRDALT